MKKQYWYSRSRSSSMPRDQPAAAAAAAAEAPPQIHGRTRPGEAADANPGCMAMVHYLIFAPGAGCVGRPPSRAVTPHPDAANFHDVVVNSSSSQNKGLEAPRNSLELDGDQIKDIQIGVQIEPAFDALARSAMRPKVTAQSSEAETPRTPSLVARLMGIDGLPEQSSPSPAPRKQAKPRASGSSTDRARTKEDQSAVKEKKKRVIPESMNKGHRQPLRSLSCNVPASPGETRSLPDTPRASTSSSARASWDVVDHPRLSLQVLKENVLDRAAQYMSLPTSPTSCGAKKKKNHRTGRREEHAREIIRQAKETVANRKSSGKKPTNGTSNKENASPIPLEDQVVVVQGAAAAAGKPTTAPPPKAQADQQPHGPRLPLAPKPPPPQRAKPSRPPPPPPPLDPPPRAAPPPAVKCKKPDGCERFATRIKKPATTTSHQAPPAGAAPLSLTDSSSVERNNDGMTSTSSPAVPLEEDPEYSYLRAVLERGGCRRTTPSRPFKGHSVAAPVDPIIFHLLELELPADEARLGPLRHRWNRKLLFHLAQEILADLLLGLDAVPSGTASSGGPALLGKLWRRVRSFPAADCKVVGDIDALVETDLEASSVRRLVRHPAVEEEAGDVAGEVAERVLDALIGECCAEESLSLSSASCGRSSSSRARRPMQLAVG